MPLDATVGTATANSYVTVAEANSYFADRAHSSAWVTATNKDQLLMSASRMLDWMLNFNGSRIYSTQVMQFPRIGVIKRDGVEVPETIIPQEVKFAVFELALSSVKKDRTVESALAGIESLEAGPLAIKTSKGYENPSPRVIPDYIRQILVDFIVSSGMSVVRLMRA